MDGVLPDNTPGCKGCFNDLQGPYQEESVVYTRLFECMEESGFRIAGPSRSLYFNDPNEVPEEKLMTEVQIPVEAQ